jgi:hypothetical protein
MSTLGDAAHVKFGKFQDTERHVSSRLPPSDKTCKYATAPSTQKRTWRDSLLIYMLLSAVSVLVVAQRSSEVPEGLMNNPVYPTWTTVNHYHLESVNIAKIAYASLERRAVGVVLWASQIIPFPFPVLAPWCSLAFQNWSCTHLMTERLLTLC